MINKEIEMGNENYRGIIDLKNLFEIRGRKVYIINLPKM